MKTLVVKSRCGCEFALNEKLMIHINPLSVAFYYAERRAIHDALQTGTAEYAIAQKECLVNFLVTVPSFPARVEVGFKSISVGCQEFVGANAKTLKKWAKGYKLGNR